MNHLSKTAFLSSLAQTTGWTVTSQGMLRDERGRCPIVAVAEDIFLEQADGPTCYRRVSEAIGLEIAVAEEIVFAADHAEPRLPIRDNLIDACRTHERAAPPVAPVSQWWWDQPMSVRARWATVEQPQLPFPDAAAARGVETPQAAVAPVSEYEEAVAA
jgi:hypothetical protein